MSLKFVIAIVSHGHYDFISCNDSLKQIALLPNVEVVIKDNIDQLKLKLFTSENQIDYLSTTSPKGFGENNNDIFEYAVAEKKLSPKDWFLIVNPDVYIEISYFKLLLKCLSDSNNDFFAPNLFKDEKYYNHENSLRHFAKPQNILNPLFLKPINEPYKNVSVENNQIVDWGSGAFLCIRAEKFTLVDGFDSRYFMYFEDVDLCKRLKSVGVSLRFLKDVKAVHKGQYKNRSLFSMHMYWYLSSLLTFLFLK